MRLVCWSKKDCDYALNRLLECVLIANDIETIPFDKKKQSYFGMTVNAYSGLRPDFTIESYAFPWQNGKSPMLGVPDEIESIYETCRILNASGIPFTYHNGVYDLVWLLWYGLPVSNYAYDSMSLWWSRYPDLPKRLDFVSSVLLDDYQYWKGDRKSDDFYEYMVYAMKDTESTLRNTLKLIEMATHDAAMRKNFFDAHMRCLAGLHMSTQGLAVDEEVMSQIRIALESEAKEKLESLRYLVADPEFNPNSPQQKKELIYEILGAKPRGPKGRFVKSIQLASTGAIPLRSIRSEHPIFRRVGNAILDSITPAKQISNVVGIARFDAGSTGSRFLTSYDGVGTTTTRFASRSSAFGHGGNAQNIRKSYRRFCKADEGCFLIEVDYSAADDVFVAYESEEQGKIDLIRSGKDTHAANALIYFGNWTYDGIVSGKKSGDPRVVHPILGVRQITKKLVHGAHYLMAGSTLLASAGREAIVAAALEAGREDAGRWTQEMLVEFCDLLDRKFRNHYTKFKREHESVDSWYRALRKEVVTTGGFMTPFNYFQRFGSDPYDDSTLRAVAATAGQAGTAGRINMVLEEIMHGYIRKRFRDGDNPHFGARPNLVGASINGISVRLQTHDSISFNVDPRVRGWAVGVEGILESYRRPFPIKGREVVVGLEADASIHWAGKEGITFSRVEQLIPWLEKNSLKYVDA